jgi:dipeptidyl aminopeptidase/acylaminoacyl peptidase
MTSANREYSPTMPQPILSRLSPADLLRERVIGGIDISPDGSQVAYSERTVVSGKDRSSIWLVGFAGGRPRRLTYGAWSDTRPRFSPDGRTIAFLSDREREGTSQVLLLPLDGGEAYAVTSFRRSVLEAEWMPDGRSLAVLATDDASHLLVGERDADPDDRGDTSATARVLRRLDWRMDGEGLLDHPRHVHIVSTGGRARRLTKGPWLAGHVRPHPNGKTIGFIANRVSEVDPDHQVHVVEVSSGRVRQRTKLVGQVSRFSWDADGTLICVAQATRTPMSEDPWIVWRVAADGSGTPLTGHLDRFAGQGSSNDERLTIIPDNGREVPHRVADDRLEQLVDPALDPCAYELAGAGERVAALMTLNSYGGVDVYALEPDRQPRRLTKVGDSWLSSRARATQEELTIKGPAGPIQTFVLSPPGAGRRRLPTILDIHGGPTWAWPIAADATSHMLVGAGYRVVRANIRGSYDRGRDWIAQLDGRWGDTDAADCHAVLDHLVKAGLADPKRLGCWGNSYGGFMVNWLVGTSDRFAAAVSSNGVANQVAAYANCDCGYIYNPQEGLGVSHTPEGVESLWRQSPLRNAANIHTPLLILQGEADLRCPPADNEQLFIALRMLRREVEYVLYPESSHSMAYTARPDRRVDRMERIVGWFARHMRA